MHEQHRLHRFAWLSLLASVALAAAIGVGSLVAWLPEFVRGLASGSVPRVLAGNDFAMFFTAAELAADDRWSDVYSLTGLANAMDVPLGTASLAYPPMFVHLLMPLTSTSFEVAVGVWFVIGIASMLVAVPATFRTVGLATLAAFSFPVYVALRFGQFVPVAVAALLIATVAVRADKQFVAGLALGFLVLKPQFLLGPLLVCLFDRRMHTILRWMLVSTVTLVLTSFALAPEGWRAFVAGLTETAFPPVSISWDYSLLGVLEPLPLSATIPIYVAIVGCAGWLAVRSSRAVDQPLEKLAIGVLFVLIISPRMVVYDWAMLAVVGGWLSRRIEGSPLLLSSAAFVVLSSLSGHSASPLRFGWFGVAAFLVALSAIVLETRGTTASTVEGFQGRTT